MNAIPLSSLLRIPETELGKFKLHLACWNGAEQPLNVYLRGRNDWVDWNQWRGGDNDFNREYIFTLIRFFHEPNKWLFGGIFEVTERYDDWDKTEVGYKVVLTEMHKDLVGRLIVDFERIQGMRGRAFRLENFYKEFFVSEILKRPYDGIEFPGYENINIDFPELEAIFKHQKNDWKAALQNVKGVYLISDKSNGKKYVGSAYGDYGIWSRWGVYVGTAHGFNDELTQIIQRNGWDYARKCFRFCLLEYRSMKHDDRSIIERESFWKEVLLARGDFGYNKN